ncbi:MAG TPA: host attachment protein [Pirellulales bacterium]|jgi:protein required for attachment to host cells|nr:host attachment protein [Pirellulales bacterium]
MNTWILICDASRARVFSREASGPWTLVQSLEHPASRLQDNELVEGQPGRQQQSFGKGSRSAMEPPTNPKEVQREAFATELARTLNHAYDLNSYADLALFAPPHFLGLLRKALGAKLAKRVVASFDKDYSLLPLHELQPRVEQLLDGSSSQPVERAQP